MTSRAFLCLSLKLHQLRWCNISPTLDVLSCLLVTNLKALHWTISKWSILPFCRSSWQEKHTQEMIWLERFIDLFFYRGINVGSQEFYCLSWLFHFKNCLITSSILLNHPLEQKHKIIDVPFGFNIGRMVSDKNIENWKKSPNQNQLVITMLYPRLNPKNINLKKDHFGIVSFPNYLVVLWKPHKTGAVIVMIIW